MSCYCIARDADAAAWQLLVSLAFLSVAEQTSISSWLNAQAQPALGGSNDAAPSSASLASGSSANQYGLLGLLTVISMSDPDVTTLALGTDLTTLGLHLNGVEPVYDTFASPWAEFPLKPDPDFKVCFSCSVQEMWLMLGILRAFHSSYEWCIVKFSAIMLAVPGAIGVILPIRAFWQSVGTRSDLSNDMGKSKVISKNSWQ